MCKGCKTNGNNIMKSKLGEQLAFSYITNNSPYQKVFFFFSN